MPWKRSNPDESNYFNYMIAFEDKGRIEAYSYFAQVHWGDQEQADYFLNYVKAKSPSRDWKILKVSWTSS
ncbi:hypothetical protein UFOVP787_187 [uncultured Caudovirales phage]|uniref:Uncharacterized protein n=1 Tax=uncultured Caudovirales phage TaxID=2100421 RepID=A0A6J5NVX2_9CAUD|nr:hypothetical protein UFOVP787_187 [uncultured Caudovirales phage]